MVCSDEYTMARNTMWQILLQYSARLGAPVLIELFKWNARANSTLEDFCRSYFIFYKMDVHQLQLIFIYLPILSFTESYIYQINKMQLSLSLPLLYVAYILHFVVYINLRIQTLFNYEDDVLENNFNILHMFVRIYGASRAPTMLVTGGSLEESNEALAIAEIDARLFSTVAMHPRRCKVNSGDPEKHFHSLLSLAKEGVEKEKVAGIGECGLDYDRLHFCPSKIQQQYFEQQFELAHVIRLPMFLRMPAAAEDFRIILERNKERVDWYRVVLDEAHTIKSSKTLGAQAAFKLSSYCRWCLIGTPLQNKLEDLYNLLCFLHVEPWSITIQWQKLIQKPYESGD
ncbi:unnamed protein product [Coffea canephora]|uniref:SNF2 N-terminal domain-containing protein n=1 Tax=Coffea canephora TaxID=49390 RepID=A0A068UNV1_COFCA|nr:unnamed protein product [Coffea canephora]